MTSTQNNTQRAIRSGAGHILQVALRMKQSLWTHPQAVLQLLHEPSRPQIIRVQEQSPICAMQPG